MSKKIVVLTLAAHPMAQGGIQTFVRRIKKYYNADVILLTNKRYFKIVTPNARKDKREIL